MSNKRPAQGAFDTFIPEMGKHFGETTLADWRELKRCSQARIAEANETIRRIEKDYKKLMRTYGSKK